MEQKPESRKHRVGQLFLKETCSMPLFESRQSIGGYSEIDGDLAKRIGLEMEVSSTPGWPGVFVRYLRRLGTLKDGKPHDEMVSEFIPWTNIKNVRLVVD